MRNFNKALTGLALTSTAALGLTACSAAETGKDRWVVGVGCAAGSSPIVVDTLALTTSEQIAVSCINTVGKKTAPTDIEVLSGRGTTLSGPQVNHLSHLVIAYEFTKDGGDTGVTQDPTISVDTTDPRDSTHGTVAISEILRVNNIGFQAPSATPAK